MGTATTYKNVTSGDLKEAVDGLNTIAGMKFTLGIENGECPRYVLLDGEREVSYVMHGLRCIAILMDVSTKRGCNSKHRMGWRSRAVPHRKQETR